MMLRKDEVHSAAQRLIFALAIYPNYRVEARGPRGCILDALDILDPTAAEAIRNGDDVTAMLDPGANMSALLSPDFTALAALAEACPICGHNKPHAHSWPWADGHKILALEEARADVVRLENARTHALAMAACKIADRDAALEKANAAAKAHLNAAIGMRADLDVAHKAQVELMGDVARITAKVGAMREALQDLRRSHRATSREYLVIQDALSADAGFAIIEELAALRAENARLEELVRLARRWLGSENAIERYDDIAEWFYRETGVMRPGKSVPAEMGEPHSIEEREQRFSSWAVAKGAEVREALKLAKRVPRAQLGSLADLLAPPRPPVQPASGLGDFAETAAWLRSHRSQYAGKWVAVRAGTLIDSDTSRLALQQRLNAREDRRELLVVQVEVDGD